MICLENSLNYQVDDRNEKAPCQVTSTNENACRFKFLNFLKEIIKFC